MIFVLEGFAVSKEEEEEEDDDDVDDDDDDAEVEHNVEPVVESVGRFRLGGEAVFGMTKP